MGIMAVAALTIIKYKKPFHSSKKNKDWIFIKIKEFFIKIIDILSISSPVLTQKLWIGIGFLHTGILETTVKNLPLLPTELLFLLLSISLT